MFSKFMEANYEKLFGTRFFEAEYIKYFKCEDFPTLKQEAIEFQSNQGQLLKGNVYFYEISDRICIFCHGMDSSHHSYMHEIEFLAKKGIMVMAYDGTGVSQSEGLDRIGFSQALVDLDYAIRYFNQSKYKDKTLFLMGHSQGGFAVANVLKLHCNVAKAVVISAPISCKSVFKQSLGKLSWLFLNTLMAIEKKRFPDYYDANSLNSLKNTQTKVLLIHSEDDTMVSCKRNTKYINKTIQNNNLTYLYCNGKNHNPNYEADAVEYMNEVFSNFKTFCKKNNPSITQMKEYMKDVDYKRMTCQDPIVMNEISQFFDEK